jgi:hypothetical protein
MSVSITDEIIDAIIQNEGRHVCRPGQLPRSARAPQGPRSMASLKPDWGQLPPGSPREEARPAVPPAAPSPAGP